MILIRGILRKSEPNMARIRNRFSSKSALAVLPDNALNRLPEAIAAGIQSYFFTCIVNITLLCLHYN
jgi:hypothetical protein